MPFIFPKIHHARRTHHHPQEAYHHQRPASNIDRKNFEHKA